MNIKLDNDSYPEGKARKIILHYLKENSKEWRCKEIIPNKNNNYIRKIIFIKNERWKYE